MAPPESKKLKEPPKKVRYKFATHMRLKMPLRNMKFQLKNLDSFCSAEIGLILLINLTIKIHLHHHKPDPFSQISLKKGYLPI